MKNLSKRFALLVFAFVFIGLLASHAYAFSSNVTFYFDVVTPIDTVVPQAKAQISAGTSLLQLEVRSVNFPDGTPLYVTFTQYAAVDSYEPIAPATIGTITLRKGEAKVKLNYAEMLTGIIDGLVITTPNGTVLLHGIPLHKG